MRSLSFGLSVAGRFAAWLGASRSEIALRAGDSLSVSVAPPRDGSLPDTVIGLDSACVGGGSANRSFQIMPSAHVPISAAVIH
jgi:hypothetical protein